MAVKSNVNVKLETLKGSPGTGTDTDKEQDKDNPVLKTVRFKEGVEEKQIENQENVENSRKGLIQQDESPLRQVKDCKYCDLCKPNWRPREAVNVPVMLSVVDNLSRPKIVRWLNDCLEDEMVSCIEELGRGTIYCNLMEMLFPRSISYIDIKFDACLTRHYIHNFNLLQTTFRKLKVNKVIPILKLVQCRLQDNLEFVLWFKKFFDANDKGHKFCELFLTKVDPKKNEKLKMERQSILKI